MLFEHVIFDSYLTEIYFTKERSVVVIRPFVY